MYAKLDEKCGIYAIGKAMQPSFRRLTLYMSRTFLYDYYLLDLLWPRVKKAGAVNFHEGKIFGGILTISRNPRIASNNRQADEFT